MKTPTLVVPWITLWSDEIIPVDTVYIRPGLDRVRYRDQRHTDRHLGVIWHRELEAQKQGEPVWAQVHARRQRRAMLDPRCQVCGDKLLRVGRIPWLLPAGEYEKLVPTAERTIVPPTCEHCWPVAEDRCPHLRTEKTVRFYVDSAIPWGVMGDLYHPLNRKPRVGVPFTNTELIPHMIAKQLVVQLDGVKPV